MSRRMVLVRDGRHQRPMLAVLNRYNIGTVDRYERGRWITHSDISRIAERMKTDPSVVTQKIGGETYYFVKGTNQHNYVGISDFRQLFGGCA